MGRFRDLGQDGLAMSRFVVALAFVLATVIGVSMWSTPVPLHAQEATPAALPSELVARTEAWDTLDPEAVAALYTEDGVMEDVPSGAAAQGLDEIAAALAGIMSGIAESRNEPVGGFRAGDMAVMEYQVTAVDAASGQEFMFRGVLVAELEGDLIRHSREYFDVVTILGQLGLMGGATPAAGTPAP
jgi:ketosteroid isomerase-like protein